MVTYSIVLQKMMRSPATRRGWTGVWTAAFGFAGVGGSNHMGGFWRQVDFLDYEDLDNDPYLFVCGSYHFACNLYHFGCNPYPCESHHHSFPRPY